MTLPKKTVRKKVKTHQAKKPPKDSLRGVHVGVGMNITHMQNELQDMTDVLLGRLSPPINAGLLTLMEVADAYYARASEMTSLIQRAEREGTVLRSSAAYKFRTGELRTFRELAKHAAALGSRRVTYESARVDAERTGKDSSFDDYYTEDGDGN